MRAGKMCGMEFRSLGFVGGDTELQLSSTDCIKRSVMVLLDAFGPPK